MTIRHEDVLAGGGQTVRPHKGARLHAVPAQDLVASLLVVVHGRDLQPVVEAVRNQQLVVCGADDGAGAVELAWAVVIRVVEPAEPNRTLRVVVP